MFETRSLWSVLKAIRSKGACCLFRRGVRALAPVSRGCLDRGARCSDATGRASSPALYPFRCCYAPCPLRPASRCSGLRAARRIHGRRVFLYCLGPFAVVLETPFRRAVLCGSRPSRALVAYRGRSRAGHAKEADRDSRRGPQRARDADAHRERSDHRRELGHVYMGGNLRVYRGNQPRILYHPAGQCRVRCRSRPSGWPPWASRS